MKSIRFETVVGTDKVIRPPAEVCLPEGTVEVTVRPSRRTAPTDTDSAMSPRAWLLEYANEAEQLSPNLPCDMAERHDHYAHGAPLP